MSDTQKPCKLLSPTSTLILETVSALLTKTEWKDWNSFPDGLFFSTFFHDNPKVTQQMRRNRQH